MLSSEYCFHTWQLGQLQPLCFTFCCALPLAQNGGLLNWDFWYVGQAGQMHFLAFSSVSGTVLPKNFHLKEGARLGLIMVCD
jgi:hypothetical protein